MGGATIFTVYRVSKAAYFNPRSPWGERLGCNENNTRRSEISIHAPRGGSDSVQKIIQGKPKKFQSTLPVGGATCQPWRTAGLQVYFNPRSPWGERHQCTCGKVRYRHISIHAPRGGSDISQKLRGHLLANFNPRSPWGERLPGMIIFSSASKFQSTLPVGGATYYRGCNFCEAKNFNPRSPWGERPLIITLELCGQAFQSTLPVGGATTAKADQHAGLGISIHAPRGGSDSGLTSLQLLSKLISIHAPRGGSDIINLSILIVLGISIHAPRGGSDTPQSGARSCPIYFNPRSPWGERQPPAIRYLGSASFQSTLPVGGATIQKITPSDVSRISIHAPRGGSDRRCRSARYLLFDFNPRSPWGERHCLK